MEDIAQNAMLLMAIIIIVVIPTLLILGLADTVKDWILKRNNGS